MPRAPTRNELLDAQTIGLLTLNWAGRVFRLSTEPVDIATNSADTYVYRGGLDVLDLAQSVEAFVGEPEYPSIAVDVVLPVDVADLVEQGYALSSATAEVALHSVGQNWDDREVILSGIVVQPVYDAEGLPTSFSVDAAPWDDQGSTLSATETVNADTWPTTTVTDSPYAPLVFGRPGIYLATDGTETVKYASPAIPVEYTGANADTLLLTRGRSPSVSIKIHDGTNEETFASLVTTQADGLGQPMTVVDISGALNIDVTASSFDASWYLADGALGDDGETLGLAGNLLRHLVRRSTRTWDLGRLETLRGWLNGYAVAGFIDDAHVPSDWIRDHLLPILPVSVVGGPSGDFLLRWPLYATGADVVERLVRGDGSERRPGVTYLRHPRDAYDHVELEWAYIYNEDSTWQGRVVIGAAPPDATTTTSESDHAIESYAGKIAAGRVATRDPRERPLPARTLSLSSKIIYSRPTALRVAQEQLFATSADVRELVYDCHRRYRWLQPGDVVSVTDDEIYLSDHIGIVTGRSPSWAGDVALTIQLWELPARDVRRLAS